MANVANSTLTTDFNVQPYYDDYDANKNYYKLLFKPGFAVQGRELTQMQTVLQKQIDRFGKHIFREGSIVLPGQFSIEQDIDYVKIKDLDNSNNSVNIEDFYLQTVRGTTNNVNAYIIETIDGLEGANTTKTIFVRYLNASEANTSIISFANSEVLTCNVGTLIVNPTGSSTGKGSRFVISEGVIFAKEHFIAFDTQSIVLDPYSTTPNARVGFFITEEIINSSSDQSLLDPALESSNYSAPGADRLKLTATLQKYEVDDTTGAPDFVELFTIENGVITENNERSQYSILRDELAKRTLDESGDYYVRGLGVRVRESLDTGTNGGLSNTGNSQLLAVGIEPGLAYVKGYEVGKLVTEYIGVEKSTTFENVSSQISTATMGSYLRCNELMGSLEHDKGTVVHLRDVASRKLSTGNTVTSSPLGSTIGTARLKTIEYHSGLLGTPTGNVNVYLMDIRMNGTNSFSNTRTLWTTNFYADVVTEANNAVLKESTLDNLLYYIGSDSVRNVKDTSGNPSVTFNFKRTQDVTIIAAGGPIDVVISSSGDIMPYGTTPSLSQEDKRDIIFVIKNTSVNISGGGTVSNVGNTTLLGSGTAFTRFNVGDKITFSGNNKAYFIDTIANTTYLTVTERLPNLSGASYWKAYRAGDVIDLTSKGFTAGAERTVSTTSTTLTFNLQEAYPTDIDGSVSYLATRTLGREYSKTLVPNIYTAINCAATGTGTTGPFNLGFSDVYQVRKIIKKTSSIPTSLSDGTDVTSLFDFDNGQRDNMYDHARITPSRVTLASTDRLLVQLDYFVPSFTSGVGYASIDSYPINDTVEANNSIKTETIPFYTSPVSGLSYNLRNYLDFRPIKANTAVASATVVGATVNPANSSIFTYEANGIRLPAPSSQFSYDYSYYFSRIDLIVMDKDGKIYTVRGIPSENPITPVSPENAMTLASVRIVPYPSLAANYAQQINRKDLSVIVNKMSNIRFTMRDIGVLKNRIGNLENYASLSLLEKSALEMKILDENGLDRFKNGIFIDTFEDHLLGDISNRDYKIIVDKKEKSIRPIYTMESVYYDYASGSNVTKTGELITLPYSHKVLVDQKAVTTTRNIELSSYRFIGKLFLNPEIDVWTDTKQLSDNALSIGPTAANLPQAVTEWDEWRLLNTGVHVDGVGRPSLEYNKWVQNPFYNQTGNYSTGDFYRIISGNGIANYLKPTTDTPWSDQRVTDWTSYSRNGITTSFSGVSESTVTLGNRVVDVSIVPYIRPQTIIVNARGLKAFTRVYVFFDGEDVSQYVTPLTAAEYALGSAVRTRPVAGTEGSAIRTDSAGWTYFRLRLPQEKRFRVGQKEIVVTDNPTNSIDASTYAKSYFVAQGLVQQKQRDILTTRTPIIEVTPVTQTKTDQKILYIDNPSCAAYSFYVKAPVGQEGMFMTKTDLYMSSKHPTLGIWVEIREMDNAGGITRNQVPFSEVWIDSDDITISADGINNPLVITYPSPVFLYSDRQYAFVIHTIGLNPDTYFWISRLGETDLRTGQKINARPLTGTFYTTNNNLNWDMVPDIDLRCTFYRASFTTGVTGEAIFGNKPVERIMVEDESEIFTRYGEGIKGNYRLTLSGNTGSIVVTDYLIGQNSGANSSVISVNGSVYTVGNTNYTTGERVDVRYSANLNLKTVTSVITLIDGASGVLSTYSVYNGNSTMDLIASNGSFYVGDTITGLDSATTANVASIENFRYSVVDFEPSYLTFSNTTIGFFMQPTSNAEVAGSYFAINENDNYYFNTEQALLSRTNEIASLAGDYSNKIKVQMSTTSEFLSPVFDAGRAHSVYVDNIINVLDDSDISEANTSGGLLYNKYISQPIVLAEGQDAEDLSVILTAYRPPTTDVRVWAKIIHSEDTDTFAQRPWFELTKEIDKAFSSLSNRFDFKEYVYTIPTSMLTGPITDNSPGGEVQYTNTQGTTFTGFKYFQIKIGLEGSNSAVVPRVADLRCLALQI